MKKMLCMFCTVALLLTMVVPAGAEQSNDTAALIMDFETGQILYAENIDAPLPPASITKLMTMHLVFEAIAQGQVSLDDQVTASANASNLPEGSSTIYLGKGETLTVRELLEAVAIISANDAGIALAEHIAGSESAFVLKMNEKAKELGMTKTNFINAHGLHTDGHVMSARDIAILSRETLEKYPEILEYSSIKFLRMNRETRYVKQGYFDLHSTYASLIGWRNIDGLKTGWTPEARRCITVTSAENGRRYIVVVMGAETIPLRDRKVKELLSQAFEQFHPVVPVKAGEVVDSIPIRQAKNKKTEIVTARDATLVLSRTEKLEDFEERIELLPNLKAPMEKGDIVGTISYHRDGKLVTAVDLVLKEDAEKASFLTSTLRYISQLFVDLGNWIVNLFA